MKLFGNYDENKIIENLSKEKQEIFSFELIKPSLVFFNKDGQSLSIITNNNKNDQEYKDLQALWNSQNFNQNEIKNLIDYKNLQHEDFLREIQILFSLDNRSVEEINALCENYIFVSDNYIKMVRILLNIEAKIPFILMGETGVGKTKLLEILSILYGKLDTHYIPIDAGTTDETIVNLIDKITKKLIEDERQNEYIWVFLD